MRLASDFIEQTTLEMIPQSVLLPPGISLCLSALYPMHRKWRTFKRYMHPDDIFKVAADRGFAFLAGDNKVVQLAAHCVLIVKSINECVEGYVKLYRCCKKCKRCFTGHFHLETSHQWVEKSPIFLLSPTLCNSVATFFEKTYLFVRMLCRRILKVVCHLFTLSMLMVDAAEAFSFSQNKKAEAVNEAVSNSMALLKQFTNNSDILLEKFRSNKEVIQKILDVSGVGCSADQFIEVLTSISKKAGGVKKQADAVDSAVSGHIINLAKMVACNLIDNIGLGSYVPKFLLPNLELYEPKPTKHYGRLAGKNLVTRLSRLEGGGHKVSLTD